MSEFSERLHAAYRKMSPDCSEIERRAVMYLVYHQLTGDHDAFTKYQFWWTASIYGRKVALEEVG